MALCGLVQDMSIPSGIALSCPNHHEGECPRNGYQSVAGPVGDWGKHNHGPHRRNPEVVHRVPHRCTLGLEPKSFRTPRAANGVNCPLQPVNPHQAQSPYP